MGRDSDPIGKKLDDGTPPPAYAPGSSSEEEDAAILPTGVLDPVYDAKARVLNRAVSGPPSL